MRKSRSRVDSSRYSRRSVIKASAGLAGATALSVPLIGAAGAQGTPAASPAAPDGAIVSSVEGVPIAYTKYPEPYTPVDEVPGSADRSALVYPFLSENYFYYAGQPDEAVFAQQHNEAMAKVAIANPTAGLFSDTLAESGAELNQYTLDTYTEIVTGRAGIEKLDEMVSQWRDRGDDIRTELEEAIAEAEANQ